MKQLKLNTSSVNPSNWKAIGEDNFIILAGSAVSIWAPSGLPSGQKVSNYLIQRILDNTRLDANSRASMGKYLAQLPFEVIMNKCNNPDLLRKWLYKCYSKGVSNEIHASIVQLALNSKFPAIITTNYDTCFEHYLNLNKIPYQVILTEQDVSKLDTKNGLILYKIHGSAELPHMESMLFNESHEAQMSLWKSNTLKTILENRNLLIIGYSGLDFEICPELQKVGLNKLIWNFYSDQELEKSPGRRRIIAHHVEPGINELIDVIGDMRDLLTSISPNSVNSAILETKNEVEPLDKLSGITEHLWTAKTILALGIGQITLDVIKNLDEEKIGAFPELINVLKIKARAYFFNNELSRSLETHLFRLTVIQIHHGYNNFLYLDSLIAVANILQDNLLLLESSKKLKLFQQKMLLASPLLSETEKNHLRARFILARVRLSRYYLFAAEYCSKDLELEKKYRYTPEVYLARRQTIGRLSASPLVTAVELFTQIGDYADRAACFLFGAQLRIGIFVNSMQTWIESCRNDYNHLGNFLGLALIFRTESGYLLEDGIIKSNFVEEFEQFYKSCKEFNMNLQLEGLEILKKDIIKSGVFVDTFNAIADNKTQPAP